MHLYPRWTRGLVDCGFASCSSCSVESVRRCTVILLLIIRWNREEKLLELVEKFSDTLAMR